MNQGARDANEESARAAQHIQLDTIRAELADLKHEIRNLSAKADALASLAMRALKMMTDRQPL